MKGQSVISAIKLKNPEMLDWALESDSIGLNELLENDFTPLQWAVVCRTIDCVVFLLQKGANPDLEFNGFSPLIMAAQEGFTNIAEALLDGNADINYRGQHGLTPLMAAARDNHLDTIQLLLSRGVNAEDKTDAGTTAQMMAEILGHKDAAKMIKGHFDAKYQPLTPELINRFIVIKE